ncbi:hypothetical protein QR680_009300 [Steinernema hermaphroditum]|uniref:Peptidase S1 domain-containing protein n=1 Tax=Steinernema hermaphroditum TaxID=289476 RepID=A0AA39M9G1_9BILA|nr:hypothetical protein QR680_009300 [Steinernema hermaphroditum]
MRLYPLPLTLLFSLGSRQSPTATATSSPSTLLVQISSYFFSGGGRRSRRNDFCTGSLISRRVVVTAGHCLRCKSGAKVSVRLVEAKKTLLLRHISSYQVRSPERCGGPASRGADLHVHRREALAPETWDRLEETHCALFGYGRSEARSRRLDLQLRRMKVRLRSAEKPLLGMPLGRHQKICEGDSGSPVVYVHGGVRYLLGVSMSVQSSESSDRPQLCGMRARGDRRRFAVGEIRRRARGNRPDLPIPEEPICNCCSKLFSKYDGFGQSDSAELRKYNDNHVMHRVLFNYLKFLVTREDLDIGFKSQDVATRAMNAYTTYLLYKKRRRRLS